MTVKKIKTAKEAKDIKSDVKQVILFRMKNCIHCKNLKPIWNKAVKRCPQQNIVEIEAAYVKFLPYDLNSVAGFPTIIATSSNKKNVEFSNNRTEEDIIAFIKRYG